MYIEKQPHRLNGTSTWSNSLGTTENHHQQLYIALQQQAPYKRKMIPEREMGKFITTSEGQTTDVVWLTAMGSFFLNTHKGLEKCFQLR